MQIYPIERRPHTHFERLALRGRTPGFCPACGRWTLFEGWADDLRETGRCRHCTATNRQRQLAQLICDELSPELGHAVHSLRDIPSNSPLVIYNTEAGGPTHLQLCDLPNYVCSEHFASDCAPGTPVNGVRHEDLQALSFADNSFDLVLSSDVFEHIPDPYRAFAEVHRVLKPGGKHVFTVAFHQEQFEDDVRALIENGEVKLLKERWVHGDPLRPEGVLVYTVPALEMLIKLDRLDLPTRMLVQYRPSRGILGNNAVSFVSRKNHKH
jgi:SAM-dependent methyltransferase